MNSLKGFNNRTFFISLAFTVMAVIISGCDFTRNLNPGELTLTVPSIPLQTQSCSSCHGLTDNSAIFETLVQFDHKTGKYKQGLAQSWSVSDDGLLWTFTIRRNVQFHDGTELLSRHVTDSLKQFFSHLRGCDHGCRGMAHITDIVTGLEHIGNRDMIIKLNRPYPSLLSALSTPAASVYRAVSIPKEEQTSDTNPLLLTGTGKFELVDFMPGTRIMLKQFPQYWGGKPPLSKVTIKAISSNEGRLMELGSGTAQASESTIGTLEGKTLEHLLSTHRGLTGLFFNCNSVPTSDVKIRKALLDLFIKEDIAKNSGFNKQYEETGFIPSGFLSPSKSYNSNLDSDKTENADLKDADFAADYIKAMIGESKLTMIVPDRSLPGIPSPTEIIEAVEKIFSNNGIELELVYKSPEHLTDEINKGEYNLLLWSYLSPTHDVAHFLTGLYASPKTAFSSQPNLCNLRDETLDRVIIDIYQADYTNRKKLINAANESLRSLTPLIPLFTCKNAGLSVPGYGFDAHSNDHLDISSVHLNRKDN